MTASKLYTGIHGCYTFYVCSTKVKRRSKKIIHPLFKCYHYYFIGFLASEEEKKILPNHSGIVKVCLSGCVCALENGAIDLAINFKFVHPCLLKPARFFRAVPKATVFSGTEQGFSIGGHSNTKSA